MTWGGHIRLAVVTDMSDRPTTGADNDNRRQKQPFHKNLPFTRNDSMSKTLLFCRQIIPFIQKNLPPIRIFILLNTKSLQTVCPSLPLAHDRNTRICFLYGTLPMPKITLATKSSVFLLMICLFSSITVGWISYVSSKMPCKPKRLIG
jgi:hypothetical protein